MLSRRINPSTRANKSSPKQIGTNLKISGHTTYMNLNQPVSSGLLTYDKLKDSRQMGGTLLDPMIYNSTNGSILSSTYMQAKSQEQSPTKTQHVKFVGTKEEKNRSAALRDSGAHRSIDSLRKHNP